MQVEGTQVEGVQVDGMPVDGAGVVITGGGNGIGRAIARRLAAEGARVVVADVDGDAAATVAAEVGGLAVPGDAASEAGVAALVSAAREYLGEIDVFFANAGVGLGTGPDSPESDWETSWQVNVMAHVRAARLLLPGWLERGRGRLVVTASAAGLLTMLGCVPYSVTKHAAVAHAEWLAATYGDRGVTVQCLCPQGVRTAMMASTGPLGELLLAPGAIEPEAVAESALQALGGDGFLILPHPQVADFYALRATRTDRWLAGMRQLQRQLDALP